MCAPAIPGVPDEAVEAGVHAAYDHGGRTTAGKVRAALAAAVPHVREQIAGEIEAAKASNSFRNVVLDRAAEIARGVSR